MTEGSVKCKQKYVCLNMRQANTDTRTLTTILKSTAIYISDLIYATNACCVGIVGFRAWI